MSAPLRGKRVVVTGVTSGIGAALAELLVESGAQVLGLGRDEAKLSAVAARLGPLLEPLRVDLAGPAGRARAFAELATREGSVDAVVNNAAEVLYASPTELELDRWRRILEVNFLGALELVQALAPKLSPGGQVVNLSSVTARFLPNPKFAPYALSKVALEAWSEALRLELQPRGIQVSVLSLGLVRTPVYDKVSGFERTKAKLVEQVPHWLEARDAAEGILWMLSRPPHVQVSELVMLPKGQVR